MPDGAKQHYTAAGQHYMVPRRYQTVLEGAWTALDGAWYDCWGPLLGGYAGAGVRVLVCGCASATA